MATSTLTFPAAFSFFEMFSRRAAAKRAVPVPPVTDPEVTQDRNAFIDEMLMRNSGAFASELDVQSMMHMYPGNF